MRRIDVGMGRIMGFSDVVTPASLEPGAAGFGASMIVVDDPVGCVVPSEGVTIMRPNRHGKSLMINAAVQAARAEGALISGLRDMARKRDEAPRMRNSKKQRLKGLRP